MSLKLSYRDKVIFIVVMVILVLVAGFFLFIRPKFQSVEKAKSDLEAIKLTKEETDAKINTLPDIIKTLKATAEEIGEKQEIFLPEGAPYENETYIRDVLKDVGADVKSINTTYTTASEINWYTMSKQHILAYQNKINTDLYNELPQEVYDSYNKVKPPVYPEAIIGVTNVNLTFESDLRFDKAYRVMDRIAEDEKTIVLNTISNEGVDVEEGQTQQDVAISLTMYSIYPLNVEKVLEETDEVKPIEPAAEQNAETTAAE